MPWSRSSAGWTGSVTGSVTELRPTGIEVSFSPVYGRGSRVIGPGVR